MGVDHLTSSVDTLLEKSMLSPIGWKCENFQSNIHPSAPTVVNGGEWEYQFEIPNKWNQLIDRVFSRLPSVANEHFLEEFHYTVVSSDLLNASNPWRLSKMSTSGLLPTIIPDKSKTIRIRNFPYMTTILHVRKILNRLKFSNGSRRRVVITLLIALYLTYQQEFHKMQSSRQNALSILKSMLDSLQRLTVLQHNYFAAHKEISNQCGSDRIGLVVTDLLGSSLDLLFYSMTNATQDLLTISNSSELSKYCGIYGVPLSELYYRLTEPANDMESRWTRLKVMRSFMLCCLLSQNHSGGRVGNNSTCDLEMCNFLRKIFPNYNLTQNSLINQSNRWKLITTNMQQLQNLTVSMTASMLRHTELINNHRNSVPNARSVKRYSKFYLPPEDKKSSSQGPIRLSTTLHGLRELEKLLIVTNEETTTTDSTIELVRQRLIDLLALWQTDDNDEVVSQGRKNGISKTKFGNRGLSLDVVQNPRESIIKCGGPHLNLSPKLKDHVVFTPVDETQSDIEQDSDYELQKTAATETSNDEEAVNSKKTLRSSDKTLIDQRIAKFQSLSDDELRLKLEEGISKFAQENKKGRQKLRSQKSFELLRKPHNKEFMSVQGALRQISSASEITLNNTFSTEETIPMYYELQKILDK
ncbi:hypothetical protein ZYGR_0A03270 [Zygosaccharomyces rouxii]|uniref:Inheritance of peroxisomes protein 2 n=2 Tax=Zygosaccharomyces rouxii TaxID=4956 RepID=C5DPZ7_ZYGRC|nr:uncharacterized protein ZYRO0A07436g [Zygosaccharomyces rouxii]KAH9198721.1 Mysoin-binding motif of peroxisomes-domain-containing protein [Zygosaccharomyces rouxii]GAV46732.1 hypothetical protein ZYGR_0A03270 [Zygosaccharomyces rouxii]CAR25758.1 ZYRO0A07436p [Zygosaccharomyces rouxii]